MQDFEIFSGATKQTKTNFNSPDQVTATTLYAHTCGANYAFNYLYLCGVSELSVKTLKD